MTTPALRIFAGPRARARLRERGLQPADVRVIPAAAGGPKGLVLNPLDRYLFGHWLPRAAQVVHLIGASIGAWRMASACLPDACDALARMAEDYVTQRYDHAPGRPPAARHVSEVLGGILQRELGRRGGEVLASPRFRLHVVTSHGRHVLARQGRLRTPLGYAGAFVANAAQRRALGGWLERVVFGDPRDELPLRLADFPTRRAALRADNLATAVLASCSIPFWLDAVHDIPGGPRGAYWDGGITDYHLHLDYASIGDGLVLYPHFGPQLVPGWLDKPWRRRQRASAALDNVVLLAPDPDWIRTLPNGRLPDRSDFKAWGDDVEGRMRAWRRAIGEARRLADEFASLVEADLPIDAAPLV